MSLEIRWNSVCPGVPKLSPDELQDEREIRDPKIRAAIREGYEEFLAGKTPPIEEFLAACTSGIALPRSVWYFKCSDQTQAILITQWEAKVFINPRRLHQ